MSQQDMQPRQRPRLAAWVGAGKAPSISSTWHPSAWLLRRGVLLQAKVPSDRRYHIVATQALIDSPMVHHLLLFACRGDAAPEVGAPGSGYLGFID